MSMSNLYIFTLSKAYVEYAGVIIFSTSAVEQRGHSNLFRSLPPSLPPANADTPTVYTY